MFGTPPPPARSFIVGDYRFTEREAQVYSSDWLIGGVCVQRRGKTWRAYTTRHPSENFIVKDGDRPSVFRSPESAARYLVEAITERPIRSRNNSVK